MAFRCNTTGVVTMPVRSMVRTGRTSQGGKLALSDTRVPLNVIAIGHAEFDKLGRYIPGSLTRYRGITYSTGQRFQIDPFDAVALVKAEKITIPDELPAPDWWKAEGRVLLMEPGAAKVRATSSSPGALKIVMGTGYDPGNAVYRFHSALNEHTKHASALVRYVTRANNPFGCPTQVNAVRDPALTRALLLDADVVHCHMDWLLPHNVGLSVRPKLGQLLVRHYHGTQFTPDGKQLPDHVQVPRTEALSDDSLGAVLVGARLTLCALRPGRIQWLPITVPVNRYAAMVSEDERPWPRRPFRVAHAPTKSILKGTRDFTMVCKRLRAKGIPIEPVMIQGKHHDAALVIKATCDATFDSFALGIQGSGLEGAAMGQPVIAGDADVADLYRRELGEVPYTFAPTWQRLEAVLEQLATDHAFYQAEAARVHAYVRTVHDYPAVARRYEQILATALGRESVHTKRRGA